MTKAEWSGWMQAIGAIFALAIAIWLPWRERRRTKIEAREKAASDADIVLRFYLELRQTNEELLGVASAHLPGGRHAQNVDALAQVLASVRALRSLPFEQVQTIGIHNSELAGDLSDFHCERVKLIGVLDRNAGTGLQELQRTLIYYVDRLKKIMDRVMGRTTSP